MFDPEEYDKECEKIRKVNIGLLELFEADLKSAGLSDKTINSHLSNVYFYINEYLLREEARHMESGVISISSFLGDYYIRKCMWSTPANIKTTAASIKKFYKCMVEHSKISQQQYEDLCREIKDNIKQWQTDCELYNDPDEENPFRWF